MLSISLGAVAHNLSLPQDPSIDTSTEMGTEGHT